LARASQTGKKSASVVVAGIGLLGVEVYAATDEVHQLFVPGRFGTFHDVLIDTTGGALGLTALWAWGRWRKRW
jgi:VanZ family protein